MAKHKNIDEAQRLVQRYIADDANLSNELIAERQQEAEFERMKDRVRQGNPGLELLEEMRRHKHDD